MGGKASRDKGLRREREIVNALREAGIPARRIPLSGASETHKGDVEFFGDSVRDPNIWNEADWRSVAAETIIAEIKARKRFPAWIMEYLGDNDCLILVEDRQEPLVIMPMSKFTELVG